MKITRDNYEVYFLDYLEGNLDDELVDGFIEFLQENPDLKEELQLVGSFKLNPEPYLFKNKEKLYKQSYLTNEEFEKTAVAYLEEDLSKEEKATFEEYLSLHHDKKKAFELFQKTKLQPDNRIIFHNKKRLYHSSKGKTILFWVTRIAAVVAIAFITSWFAGDIIFNKMYPDNQLTISENKNENAIPKGLPEKKEKKEEPVLIKENTHLPSRKPEPKAQPHKSLRESNRGRIDHEKVALIRTPLEVPEKIPALQISIQKNIAATASLDPIHFRKKELPSPEFEERFLADALKEKTGLNNLSLNKLTKTGLKLVSGFSGEKFNYKTNPDGEITELNFDSRLLAFSIPTSRD